MLSPHRSRIAVTACRPSSLYPGGIRMSTIATSGLAASTSARSWSASPAWPTTSNPASLSRRAVPSLTSRESSAITSRSALGAGWALTVGASSHGEHVMTSPPASLAGLAPAFIRGLSA